MRIKGGLLIHTSCRSRELSVLSWEYLGCQWCEKKTKPLLMLQCTLILMSQVDCKVLFCAVASLSGRGKTFMIILQNRWLDMGVSNLGPSPLLSVVVVAQWLHIIMLIYCYHYAGIVMFDKHPAPCQLWPSYHADKNCCNQFPKLHR